MRFLYPFFWVYKLITLSTRFTVQNVKNFLIELFKETKLVKAANVKKAVLPG
jgi:hypothetical protein